MVGGDLRHRLFGAARVFRPIGLGGADPPDVGQTVAAVECLDWGEEEIAGAEPEPGSDGAGQIAPTCVGPNGRRARSAAWGTPTCVGAPRSVGVVVCRRNEAPGNGLRCGSAVAHASGLAPAERSARGDPPAYVSGGNRRGRR